jgi:hypothetical protein
VTIEQASGEFCDYLHLQQNSCVVDAGQAVGYGTDLAKVWRSGTGNPHIHQAVTNLGEHTTDRARYDVLWQQGWRLKVFDRFTA